MSGIRRFSSRRQRLDHAFLNQKLAGARSYMHLRARARNAFEIRYQETIDPDRDRWELCAEVLSRRDIVDKLSQSW